MPVTWRGKARMEFLDTNVIIRYLTNDPPHQATQAYRLFKDVELGSRTIRTCEGVIVETVQVLASKVLYNLPRPDIKTHVSNVISMRGLKLPYKRVYLRALDLFATANIDFVDALNVAHMEQSKITTIVSFDRDYDRLKSITRIEP